MKQTKMRRKALLSSIAMLLVAVVALSSATYAWFTANTAANVKGINLSTNATSDLKFATSQSGTYASSLDLQIDQVLAPVSSVNTTAFYQVTTDNTAAVATAGATPVTAITTADTANYLSTTFYAKSQSDNNLYVTGLSTGTSQMDAALRVAVKVGSNAVKIFAPSDSGTTMQALNGTASGLTGVTFSTLYAGSATGVDFDTQTISANGTAVTDDAAHQLKAGVAQAVQLWVWLEGNDSDCVDTMAGTTLTNLTVNFSTSA